MTISDIRPTTYFQSNPDSSIMKREHSGFSDIIQKTAQRDIFQRGSDTDGNYKDISNYKNVSGSSSVGKGQPINVNDAKPTEVGDYKIRYTDDGYLDIRSKTSGEGFRWKLASNKVQVDSETGLKFLINDLGSGFFNMLPVDAEMEEALKQSLGVDELETSELKGFTVHQDDKTGIHFITANGFEGQGGQIVMNDR